MVCGVLGSSISVQEWETRYRIFASISRNVISFALTFLLKAWASLHAALLGKQSILPYMEVRRHLRMGVLTSCIPPVCCTTFPVKNTRASLESGCGCCGQEVSP